MADWLGALSVGSRIELALDVANIVIFGLSVTALYLTVRQLRADARDREKHADQEHAREMYRRYLDTCLAHPDLSIARYDASDAISLDRYDTFLSIMLHAADEMLRSAPIQVEYWRQFLSWQVRTHESYLRETFLVRGGS